MFNFVSPEIHWFTLHLGFDYSGLTLYDTLTYTLSKNMDSDTKFQYLLFAVISYLMHFGLILFYVGESKHWFYWFVVYWS